MIDQITVTERGVVLWREVTEWTELIDNEEVIKRTYFRSSLAPNASLVGVPNTVAEICAATWTPEVIAAYNEKKNT